jgi:hypothetical protein
MSAVKKPMTKTRRIMNIVVLILLLVVAAVAVWNYNEYNRMMAGVTSYAHEQLATQGVLPP